jgi:hydrogenase expression/formation protein HypC
MSAQVDLCGATQAVLIDLLPDLRIGEYVLVHAGFAIQRLEPEEAKEIFKLFEELTATTDGANFRERT